MLKEEVKFDNLLGMVLSIFIIIWMCSLCYSRIYVISVHTRTTCPNNMEPSHVVFKHTSMQIVIPVKITVIVVILLSKFINSFLETDKIWHIVLK